jgi:hypothetical protein
MLPPMSTTFLLSAPYALLMSELFLLFIIRQFQLAFFEHSMTATVSSLKTHAIYQVIP